MPWYRPLLYLWAAPASLLGLIFAPFALVQGGSVRIVDGVIEVQGGIVTRLLHIGLPWVGGGDAMTLGHVVWGRNSHCLERTRLHERVHVEQYQRWGPLFIPLYLVASLVAWRKGLDPYRDNIFEREAYDRTGTCGE